MSEENKPEEPIEQAQAEAVTTEAESVEAPAETVEPTIESLQAELDAANAKANENWDMYLRANAETENVRKRVARESDKARKFALEKFAGELLAVVDSIQMGAEAAGQEGASLEAIKEGAELTLKIFKDTLNKFDVIELDPVGEKFNPEFHEAMVMQPSADAEPNTVLMVVQKGYTLNDRVLRPARVIVASAVPAA